VQWRIHAPPDAALPDAELANTGTAAMTAAAVAATMSGRRVGFQTEKKTGDRAGEPLGATIVQILLLTSLAFLRGELLAVAIGLAAVTLWLGRRLDRLYLGAVEQQLVKHIDEIPVVGSDVS
jgi:hypothetical protein